MNGSNNRLPVFSFCTVQSLNVINSSLPCLYSKAWGSPSTDMPLSNYSREKRPRSRPMFFRSPGDKSSRAIEYYFSFPTGEDRNSVVTGKRVEVRVARGGGSMI